MKIARFLLLMLTFVFSLVRCDGGNTTTGNPGDVLLSIQGTKPGSLAAASVFATDISVKDTSGTVVGTLSIADARVALENIEFELSNATSDDSDEIDLAGPFVIDLLTDTVTPSLSTISLPSGTYREIKLSLHKIAGNEEDDSGAVIIPASDPLFGNSIYVEGTYSGPTANSGNVTNMTFKMSFDLSQDFELTGASDTSEGLIISESAVNNVIVAFRLAKWFSFADTQTNGNGLEPNQLVVSGGVITLDENSSGDNQSIRSVIENNIKESADYGKDSDGDGKLAEDEDDDPDSEDGDDD